MTASFLKTAIFAFVTLTIISSVTLVMHLKSTNNIRRRDHSSEVENSEQNPLIRLPKGTMKNPTLDRRNAIAKSTSINWTDQVSVEGKLNSSKKYAVFSFTTDNENGEDYMFYAPLTTLAWKRIGFESVILIVGSTERWISNPLCRYVRSSCLQLGAVLIHMNVPQTHAITVSQVGRIFAANILSATSSDIDFVYMITSDSDLWPLSEQIYLLRSDMAILSINSGCCGTFIHRNRSYEMLPMSNIGMRVMTWNRITKQGSTLPNSSHDVLTFLEREFGDVALRPAVKGENRGWYLDQLTISMLLKNWTDQYGYGHVMLIPRNTDRDRIDRSRWRGDTNLGGMVDAHLPLKPFSTEIWKQITPLLRSMYGLYTDRYNWSMSFFDGYTKLRSGPG